MPAFTCLFMVFLFVTMLFHFAEKSQNHCKKGNSCHQCSSLGLPMASRLKLEGSEKPYSKAPTSLFDAALLEHCKCFF